MRFALYMIPLLALTACATPREACINNAMRDLRILNSLITETRANIARGYALEERQDVLTLPRTCSGRNADGTAFTFRCDKVETFTTTVPVAINLDDERAKLETLLERQSQLKPATDQAIAQCIAANPE